MEDRGTLVDELRTIRAQLSECIGAAEHLHAKLFGPTPKDSGMKEPGPSESVTSITGQIRRQTDVLQKLLAANHDVIGNFNSGSQGRSIPTAAGFGG